MRPCLTISFPETATQMPEILLYQESAVLTDTVLHLVRAEVTLDTGRTHTGFGRDSDLELAQRKAISEAIERISYRTLPATRWSEATALPSYIGPGDLVGYLPEQYANPAFGMTPFSEDEPRHWVMMHSAVDSRTTFALADFVCGPSAFDEPYRRKLVTHATTSGCASGDDLTTCIERATLELVERDAFMLHWFAQVPGISVTPATLPEAIRDRLAHLASRGATAGVQLLALGRHPTWFIWIQHEALHFTTIGTATGFDGATALMTAMAEAETLALARLDGVPPVDIDPVQVRTPADHAALYATQSYFRQADAICRRSAEEIGYPAARASFISDWGTLRSQLAAAGHPVYWTELCPPGGAPTVGSAAIHTARALAPGLIPMSFGHGRQPAGMDQCGRTGLDLTHPFA